MRLRAGGFAARPPILRFVVPHRMTHAGVGSALHCRLLKPKAASTEGRKTAICRSSFFKRNGLAPAGKSGGGAADQLFIRPEPRPELPFETIEKHGTSFLFLIGLD
jgi:hypothetical protein